jgi:DeoR/GlpR family transcriptional regulator of sugar metabolism
VIFGVNDDSALGALDAFRAAGLDEDRLLLATFGLEGDAAKRLLHDGRPDGISVAMFPEVAGRACVDAAVCAFHGALLPEHITTPFAIVTPDTLADFYQRDARTGRWLLNWDQVERLTSISPALRQVKDCHHRRRPRRIGYVETFSSHEWYRNVRLAMQERSRHLGVYLEVVDASEDLAFEIDAAKRAIGAAAARHVRDGDTIILDAGATTAYLAEALQGREGVTVITNSLRVLAQLRDEHSITLVSSGGVVRRESQAFTGRAAEATFQDLRVDKAFLSAAGISLDFGFSSTNIPEATVKQSMLAAAREVILVADSTKIGTESLVKVAPLERVQRLITDPGVSAEDRLALSQRGVEVTIAGDAALTYPAAPGNGLPNRAPGRAFLEEV